MTDNELKTVNFDGLEYKIEDLTPRTIEGFNMLVKLQSAIAEIAFDLKVKQSAQLHISEEVKSFIKEDKIKPNLKKDNNG